MVAKMPEIQDSRFRDTSKYAKKYEKSNEYKNESAVNREIATLLLNLASRTHNSAPKVIKDNCVSYPSSEAMDLSNYAKSNPRPPMHVSSSSPGFQATSVPSTVNPYTLLSPNLALAGINNTSMAASLGSSYLLQNLLIGQIQQLASPQQLANSQLMPNSQKMTQNVTMADATAELKTNNTLISSTQSNKSRSSQQNSATSLLTLPLTNLGNSTIPLLSGQIVAQLNSLLFSVHGIADKNIEMNVQGQLAAIYTRLQEIVTMITLSKKKEIKSTGKSLSDQQVSKSDLQKQLEIVTSTKEKEEKKITKQLEEYQKAMVQSKTKVISIKNNENIFNKFSPNSSVANILRNQTPISTESLRLDIPSNKSQNDAHSPESTEYLEVGSSSPNTRRRLSKDSVLDSPPEKRSRMSLEVQPGSTSPMTVSRSKSSGKGGKGIRNRVFCGDCPGCLKNDDCGQCRYCRDKTKFGGQNRLRQKCLHRRCQMDTHRRSNGSTASHPQPQPTQSDSISTSPQIYNGVDLARFATQQQSTISDAVGGGDVTRPSAEQSIFSSILGNVPPISLDIGRQAQTIREEDPDSQDRDGVDQQQSRSDKWKAKHEAMLKLASGPTSRSEDVNSQNTEFPNTEQDRLARQQVFENSSLVITLNETTKENDKNIEVSRGGTLDCPRVSSEGNTQTMTEKSQHKVKFIDRSLKAKIIDSKQEAGRLTTRSMKTVLAV